MLYSLLVFFAGCSFGLLSPIVKLAYTSGLQPDQVVFMQFFMAWAILTGIVLLTSRRKVNIKKCAKLILVGVSNGMAGLFFFLALQTLPASIAIVILFQFAWMGVLIEAIIDRQWPSRDKLWSVLVLVLGIVMAGGILESEIKLDPVGVLWATLAAFSQASFILFSGRVVIDEPPVNRSVWMITGSVLFSAFVYPPKFLIYGQIQESLIWFGLCIGLLGGVIPTLFLAKGVPQVGGGMSTILCSSELPVTILASALILSEKSTLLQWCGIVLILLGICTPYISSLRNRHSV